MSLEEKSRDELKLVAKKVGLKRYHNWSKGKLMEEIRKAEFVAMRENSSEIITDPLISPTPVRAKLSVAAQKWETYFVKTGTTAEAFLNRYPAHKFKSIIAELID